MTILILFVLILIVMTGVTAIVSIDLVAAVLSIILPFAIPIGIVFIIITVIYKKNGNRSLLRKRTYLSLIIGIILAVAFIYLPRPVYHFSMNDVVYVSYYDLYTNKATDTLSSPELVKECCDIISDMKMHYLYSIYIPDYISRELDSKREGRCWIGLYDKDQNKLTEIYLTNTKQVSIFYPASKKNKWYKLYKDPDIAGLEEIRRKNNQ